MNKDIAAIFVILISLMSTTLFAQSSGINDNINREIFEFSTKQSVNPVKFSPTFSIGAGYDGLFEKTSRPNGFNIQADVLYPVSENFALNIGINYSQFPGYHYDEYEVKYNSAINDTVYTHYFGDYSAITHIQFTPGVSFGNINRYSKFNYFVTAGLTIGINREGKGILNMTSTYSPQNNSLTIEPSYHFNFGAYASGRISYKVSDKFNIFIEPAAVSNWSDNAFSNYHLNGGVSLAL
ncbi:MAG: hypothetical protein NTY74_00865 [Ignavibacteriae bacterium]|nr:hypothetical protein [Ignavibacteriota bacterium]